MPKEYHKFFIYISFIFLLIVLHGADYLEIPHVVLFPRLIVSLAFLFAGFIINALAQKKLLDQCGLQTALSISISAVGLSVFGKYIPGKVWMVMGKTMYLSDRTQYPVAELSVAFVRAQLIGIWCGLTLGMLGLFLNPGLPFVPWIGLLFLAGFTMALFSGKVHDLFSDLIAKILKKDFKIPKLNIKRAVAVLPWFLGTWILWGMGFYYFATSIQGTPMNFSVFFCFPLAGTIGILFVIIPGGIGIRESIIIAYLSMEKLAITDAVTISTASRLWFLCGEILIFLFGYLLSRHNRPGSMPSRRCEK